MSTDMTINSPTGCLRKLPIERAHGLTPEIFHERYLSGIGMPVILTDAIDSWGALSRWSFDLFKARYGADTVGPRTYVGTKRLKLMKLSEFLDYLDAPDAPSSGLWLDPETKYPCPPPSVPDSFPLYLGWNVFGLHPELLDDVELSPKFVEDWLPLLPPGLRKTLDSMKYSPAGLMIGSKGAQIGLHYDFLRTHAYLAQVIGRKRCLLFTPEDSVALYKGKVNPDVPDFEKFPLFRNSTAYECVLNPGELLFMPCRWWHHVVCLEKSITVNYNFFNRVNFSGYLTRILRVLPEVLEGLEQLPDQREALGIKWKSRGFDFTDSATM
jgi:hypothetical protein